MRTTWKPHTTRAALDAKHRNDLPEGSMTIVRAIYDIETGRVRFQPPQPGHPDPPIPW